MKHLRGPPRWCAPTSTCTSTGEKAASLQVNPSTISRFAGRAISCRKRPGDYKFFSSADDGVRLYLGDDIAIDDWQPHSQTLDMLCRHLEAGQPYKIRLNISTR